MENERFNQLSNSFNLWYQEKEEIARLFKMRDKKAAAEPMNRQIENFLDVLFKINKKLKSSSEALLDDIDDLSIKPINCKERLSFLFERPAHYHSFIQLAELYEELEKQYKKKVAIEQNKTRMAD